MRWCMHGFDSKVLTIHLYRYIITTPFVLPWNSDIVSTEQVIRIWSQRSKKAFARWWHICGWILRYTQFQEATPHHHPLLHHRHRHPRPHLHLQRRVNVQILRRNWVNSSNTRLSQIHHQLMEMDSGKAWRQWTNSASEGLLIISSWLAATLDWFTEK